MKLKFLLCLGAFCATPLFADHDWPDRSEGEYIRMNMEKEGIPEGTILPVAEFGHTNSGSGYIIVYYQSTQKKKLYSWHENQFWNWVEQPGEGKNIVRSLGFIAGFCLVGVFALAWNSRTV